ncbi:MAG: class I SAM-dependent methyltransferase [Thermoanaerobaculia bacterium]
MGGSLAAGSGIPVCALASAVFGRVARGRGRLLSASALPPAVRAFDALAGLFDERFGAWQSVAAQRRAVRRELLSAFPEEAALLELGGGTGEDALFLARHSRRVHVTDGAPAMVMRTREKAEAQSLTDRVTAEAVAIEELGSFAEARATAGLPPFAGAYSNFAVFNCVEDLPAAGRALARLVRPGGRVLLVIFGPLSPGEILTLLLRGEGRTAFRRLARGKVPARVGGHEFTVRYPPPSEIARAFSPGFALTRILGIGVFVPPSSAEPEISSWPRLLSALEALDRIAARPLAHLGDHILLVLERVR